MNAWVILTADESAMARLWGIPRNETGHVEKERLSDFDFYCGWIRILAFLLRSGPGIEGDKEGPIRTKNTTQYLFHRNSRNKSR